MTSVRTIPYLAHNANRYIANTVATSLISALAEWSVDVQESGNPAIDDLRERVAELAGINLTDFLEEGKGAGSGGQTQGGKGKAKVICTVVGHELSF